MLSVGQMVEKNYTLHFQNHSCIILDCEGNELMNVKMLRKSFPVEWTKSENLSLTSRSEESELWHKRFGHFHYLGLKELRTRDMALDLPEIEEKNNLCIAYQLGKLSIPSFPSDQAWRASDKLQLIHTDVCGPMKIESLNGSRYFVLFIDDYSRMAWVYFLKQKNEVADVFRKFKLLDKNQAGTMIKAIRSDNGTEYISSEFCPNCHEAGIQHQFTTSYTPQQNGVSERRNRTIMEMAEKKLPKMFWAEAVNTVVYLLNRLPTKAVKKQTPVEALSGVKPAVGNLKNIWKHMLCHGSSKQEN